MPHQQVAAWQRRRLPARARVELGGGTAEVRDVGCCQPVPAVASQPSGARQYWVPVINVVLTIAIVPSLDGGVCHRFAKSPATVAVTVGGDRWCTAAQFNQCRHFHLDLRAQPPAGVRGRRILPVAIKQTVAGLPQRRSKNQLAEKAPARLHAAAPAVFSFIGICRRSRCIRRAVSYNMFSGAPSAANICRLTKCESPVDRAAALSSESPTVCCDNRISTFDAARDDRREVFISPVAAPELVAESR